MERRDSPGVFLSWLTVHAPVMEKVSDLSLEASAKDLEMRCARFTPFTR
jgi:hypothetical protein